LSGALLALSFPRYGHPALAFIALTPLYVALCGATRPGELRGVSTPRAFFLGLLTGIVHYAGTLYWTSGTVRTFGGLSLPVAVFVAGLLVLYMALYIGGAAAVSAVLIRRFGATGLLLTPAAFVSAEYLRAYAFGGFPWIPLGSAVVTLLPLAQLASIGGVYLLSWVMAFLNASFALVAVRPGRPRLVAVSAALGLLMVLSVWGAARIRDAALTREGAPVSIGLIQGNIPQSEKWDRARAPAIFRRYLQMTREAAAKGGHFILWPESATPFFFHEDAAAAEQVRTLVRETGTPLLFGTDEIERGTPDRYYNSAFVLDPGGATAAIYRKVFLVPFGEYVPFGDLLTFVGPLVEAVSAFTPGTSVTMMPVDGHMVSTAICYEVVYPHLIAEGVRAGSEMITTITNDAWYGESSAPFQHFELAKMRAIEQGRYLVRAANTGISGIVDPYGRELARSGLFETTTVIGEARFIQSRTVYATIGDLPAQLAVLLTLLGVGVSAFRSGARRV
jgi:apolipoprotein N-acyltransferase